jgi:phosphoesterase RecJ-like protein
MNNSEGQIIWQNISHTVELLKSPAKKIAILCHLNPDGDTLGSALALNRLFTKMGHSCDVISPNDYPEFLKWMPGSGKIVILKHEHDRVIGLLKNAEMIFAIDFNEIKRFRDLRDVFESSSAFRVLIDHHPDPTMKVDCMLSDTSASSTAELVYRFIHEAPFNMQMDAEISACLFTGIMTDTGCFSYNSSNRKTWETVADLLEYGIDKDEIYSLVYDNYSEHRMRFLGYSLNEKLEVFPEYRTGIISLSKADMKKYHFEVGDSEGFVNYPLSIKGVSFSALFLEKDDHIKLSFRSKGSFPVNEFSRDHFNGGGHKNASGGEVYCSLEDALKQFKDLLPRYRDKLNRDED